MTTPSTGIFSPGTHAQTVARLAPDRAALRRSLAACDRPRGRRGEIEQRLIGAAGAAARAEFEHLAEQHEHDDDGGGLEIKPTLAAVLHRVREEIRARASPPRCRDTPRPTPRAISVNMFKMPRDAATASRARRTASPPRTTGVESANCIQRDTSPSTQTARRAPEPGAPSRARTPAASGPRRSRSAASCRAVRRCLLIRARGRRLRFQRHAALGALAGMILLRPPDASGRCR